MDKLHLLLETKIIPNDSITAFKKELADNSQILKMKFGEKESPLLLFTVRCQASKIFNLIVNLPQVSINGRDKEGTTPLINAAIKNNLPMVKKLLAHPKIQVNARTMYGKTALINAAQKGHTKVVNLLLVAGADVRLRETQRTKKSCANRNASNMARVCGHQSIYQKLQNRKVRGSPK